MKANHVYLIPPSTHLSIFHNKLIVVSFVRDGSLNLPVDILFNSLAIDQTDKAIAIILSGTGSDGSRGARTIKEKLGMVMIQDESTAAFDGMPRSALASIGGADFILPPEDMGAQLLEFIRHPYVASDQATAISESASGLTRLFAILREHTKLDFTYYKPSTITRRIDRRMVVNNIDDLEEYVTFVAKDKDEINQLYHDMLIGVTRFYRDEVWDGFENQLRSYVENSDKDEFRIWVTACSTGEEAYTVAMICHEIVEQMDRKIHFKLFATDVDQQTIFTASNGVYPNSVSADIEKNLCGKYFTFQEDTVTVMQDIRKNMVFAKHNLITDPPFTSIDIITCRNMLIYLQQNLQQKVIETFNFSLVKNGLLLLGSSETVGDMDKYFEPIQGKLFKSKGKKKLERVTHRSQQYRDKLSNKSQVRSTDLADYYEPPIKDIIVERLLKSISGNYLPTTLVINEQHELMYVLGDTSGLLIYPDGHINNDISKLAHTELVVPLITGIHHVIDDGKEISYSNLQLTAHGKNLNIHVTIRLLPEKTTQDTLVVVFIENIEECTKQSNASVIADFNVGEQVKKRVIDLEQELQFHRESLQTTVEELETSNEELQATNEELLASNEELQSTNEELHSVNEELYTVNAEYQGKITELVQVKNDLNNLLDSTDIGSIFLDENLEIRRFTPKITECFNIIAHDIGRPFEHITHHLNFNLLNAVESVHNSKTPEFFEVKSSRDQHYELRILPYRISENIISGVVITLIEDSKMADLKDK